MAGIAGVLCSEHGRSLTERMLKVIAHRGPDTAEVFSTADISGGVCASKLSAARGDGFARDADIAVLFDGEIYNPRDGDRSDAEVVLELYRRYGRAFPAHLEGVFACAVCDGRTLTLARDSVGVRPLYRGTTGEGRVCFASEAKALVGVADDVTEQPPATTWSNTSGVAGFVPRLPAVTMTEALHDGIEQVRRCLTAAVQRRLEDGAVGACLLSGGLDSSIIACAAYQLGSRMPLVTVGMDGAPDIDSARIVAEHLGAEHHVHLYDAEDVAALVPRAVRTLESFDEDCVSGAISNLFASAKAREFTNCILSGEGGDELFGGYHLLKELPDDESRLAMMSRLIEIAYNTAVQRLDRSMMANSINYRTPFIDTDVIALAQHLPVQWKIAPNGNEEPVEKYILREAFKDLLPDTIYRRRKLRFSAGTGTDGLMDRIAADQPDAEGLDETTRRTREGYVLSSPKELWYYRLFKEAFPAPAFERLVGRWDPGK